MTNKEMLNQVMEVLNGVENVNEELLNAFEDFKENTLAKLEREADARAKKTQESHAAIRAILSGHTISDATPTQIKDMINDEYTEQFSGDEDYKSLSVQKVVAVLKGMVKDELAIRKEKTKKQSVYTVISHDRQETETEVAE